MRKKTFTVFCLILLACSLLHASYDEYSASTWFSPYPAGFNVNLSDTDTYCGVPSLNSWGQPGNNDTTLVGLIGLTSSVVWHASIWDWTDRHNAPHNRPLQIVFSFDFVEEPWYYVSASEPYLKRPFGLDFVVVHGSTDGADGGTEQSVVRVGYNPNETTSKDETIVIDIDAMTSLDARWVNVVLTLPNEEEAKALGADTTEMLSADDYYCTFTVTIRDKDTLAEYGTWTYTFSGYIGTEPDNTSAHVFFNVLPKAEANSINVSDLSTRTDSNPLQIGTYSYETQAFMSGRQTAERLDYDSQRNNQYYIFASSNRDPSYDPGENEGYFKLTLEGLDVEADGVNGFNYLIGLQSDTGSTQWFDGTDNTTDTAHLKLVRGTSRTEDMRDGDMSLVFYDTGEIVILPNASREGVDPSRLTSGVYRSTVYFHVVSNY